MHHIIDHRYGSMAVSSWEVLSYFLRVIQREIPCFKTLYSGKACHLSQKRLKESLPKMVSSFSLSISTMKDNPAKQRKAFYFKMRNHIKHFFSLDFIVFSEDQIWHRLDLNWIYIYIFFRHRKLINNIIIYKPCH